MLNACVKSVVDSITLQSNLRPGWLWLPSQTERLHSDAGSNTDAGNLSSVPQISELMLKSPLMLGQLKSITRVWHPTGIYSSVHSGSSFSLFVIITFLSICLYVCLSLSINHFYLSHTITVCRAYLLWVST